MYYFTQSSILIIFFKKKIEQVFPGREDGTEETLEDRFFLEIECAPVTTTTAAGRSIDRQSDGKN